jgi:hypothetical protein
MVPLADIRESEPWTDSGLDSTLEPEMNDEDLAFDDIEDGDDLAETVDTADTEDNLTASGRGLASWRRIEMAKEDKYLQSVLADLDDYYDFDDVDDDMVANYSN